MPITKITCRAEESRTYLYQTVKRALEMEWTVTGYEKVGDTKKWLQDRVNADVRKQIDQAHLELVERFGPQKTKEAP